MATPQQIDEQIQLERHQCNEGSQRLSENTEKLEKQTYASATIYGSSSINALLPLVVERIESTMLSRICRGHSGVHFKDVYTYLKPIEATVCAAITVKVLFDNVFSPNWKKHATVSIVKCIGRAIENEAMMRHYEDNCPGLLNAVKTKYWHSTTGTDQKVTIIKTIMGRYDDVKNWERWSSPTHAKLGGWLMSCVFEACNWFETIPIVKGNKKQINTVIPTAEFLAQKDALMAQADLFSPIAYPMLIPPNDWSEGHSGGYLLNELTQLYPMVRTKSGNLEVSLKQGKQIYAFLNQLQKTAYVVSPFIMGVAETLMERRIAVGKFLPIVELPLPPKPSDIAENYDSRKNYRRRAAEVLNVNAAAFKRSCRTRMTMNTAAKFKDKSRWYLPWSADFRGRVYPIPNFLSPQSDDFGKSLLRFADESPVNKEAKEWLAFQVGTCWGNGLDKQSIQKRLEWVSSNHNLITAIATDPISNISQWENASEPWQFLHACYEFHHCCIAHDRTTTGLPVAVDGSCSGIQVLAGLSKDRSAAALTNCVPSAEPADAYRTVALTAKPNCPPIVRPFLDRSTVKRCVMTLPYNSQPYSNRLYLKEAFKKKHFEIDNKDLDKTVKAVRNAMEEVVPGAMQTMRWINNEVTELMKKGVDKIEWITPVGFHVVQKYNKPKIERITLKLLGKVNLYMADGDDDKVNNKQHINATAPNLVHSLDSAMLCLATLRFGHPISVIHDSILCRATDMSHLSIAVRQAYNDLFGGESFLESWASQIGATTKPPLIGDLDVSEVLQSTYFFS